MERTEELIVVEDFDIEDSTTSVSKKKGALIRINGDLGKGNLHDLRVNLANKLKENRYNIVVDLSDMKFISYGGVGVLVEKRRQFREHNGDLIMANPNLYAKRLFRITGVRSLFEGDNGYHTVESAIASFD